MLTFQRNVTGINRDSMSPNATPLGTPLGHTAHVTTDYPSGHSLSNHLQNPNTSSLPVRNTVKAGKLQK